MFYISIRIYSTMEGGIITTMIEDEINKAYHKLNKEMKYYITGKNNFRTFVDSITFLFQNNSNFEIVPLQLSYYDLILL